MIRFIRLFTISKAFYSLLPLSFLVLCEKQAEILGYDVVGVRLLFVLGLAIAAYYKPSRIYNQLWARKLLWVTAILIPLIFYLPYVVALVSPIICTMFQNVSKYMMDKGVKYNNKFKVDSTLTVLYAASGFIVYSVASITTINPLVLLHIPIISYITMTRAIKIWVTHDTREHFIINQQQINASASLNYRKPNYKLRDSIKIKELMLVFSVYVLCISSIPAVGTLYVQKTLEQTQESQFIMMWVLMLGGLISSKFHSYIGSRVRVSFMMQYSIFFVGVFMFLVYGKVHIYYMYAILFILGLMQEVIFKSVTISIHQNSKDSLLNKRMGMVKAVSNLLPILSVGVVVSISALNMIKDEYFYLAMGFVSIMTTALLITVRLFRPKYKDMTYQKYR